MADAGHQHQCPLVLALNECSALLIPLYNSSRAAPVQSDSNRFERLKHVEAFTKCLRDKP